jgi:PASTA domain-containing protein/beta-ketoacyl synthase-like protein
LRDQDADEAFMRRVVVTGMGIVSSIGNNTQEVLASLREAKSGISRADKYAELGFRCQVHGAPTLNAEEAVDRRAMRFLGGGAAWNHVAMEQAIRDAGLEPSVTEREDDTEDPGTVLQQDPAGGSNVAKGSTVKLVVAKAPPDVEVPDVVDQQRDEAEQALKDAGFEVRVREETVDTLDQDGIVISQQPTDGEQRPKGSRVTIVVGKFEPPLNPEPTATPTETPTPSPTP